MKITFGDITGEAFAILREHKALIIPLVAAMTAGFAVMDLVSDKLGNFSGIISSVFVQYIFLEQVLSVRSERRRFGSMLGASMLAGLGIIVGLVFLVLPGLFVAVRWALAPAYVVTEGQRASESLSSSWDATRENWLPLMLVYLVLAVPSLVILVGIGFSLGFSGATPGWVETVLLNLMVTVFTVGNWAVVAAAFRLLGERRDDLESLFA
ncbi:MAG: hypothetical protein E2586_10725 [Novosphingobium sp.]|uniref:hypothetical protein n=1 Tax=Novosphingobium sp. TaxID=1874826 RepID=UPI0012BEF01F|nr:hypothetical protein [Novosphingobium sp.]MPS68960.1 hypothetical protein [Novosphingobium sp.]